MDDREDSPLATARRRKCQKEQAFFFYFLTFAVSLIKPSVVRQSGHLSYAAYIWGDSWAPRECARARLRVVALPACL